MQLTHLLTFAVLLAGSALAVPAPDAHRAKPPKPVYEPPPPSVVNQSNSCGNGAQPYCCDSDNGGSTVCNVSGGSSVCSGTTVCCNANNSAQSCLGKIKARLV
ncbi:hypothetical protein MMC29_001434 [Sticta canariensis]|nr:hypothetical protein [Sticta canariensis]